jgi:2-polyprenyl-3-methyl-5-hydroxy-6-metoxy-1,4-benzoquinol methylase
MLSILTVKNDKQCHTQPHDFSLESGERQTATKLESIRHDHRVRYDFAIKFLNNVDTGEKKMFGLDIFCGTGYGTYMVATQLSCTMLGLDGSKEAILFANQHYTNKNVLYSHKLFPFCLPNNTFDFITCYESLEHVKNSAQLIEQLNTSLKSNGFLFLSTPNERCFPLCKNFNKFHYRHYTNEEVMTLIKGLGDYKLITWLGQDLYKLKGGKSIGSLADHQMELHEMQEGQLMIYVFQKMVSL